MVTSGDKGVVRSGSWSQSMTKEVTTSGSGQALVTWWQRKHRYGYRCVRKKGWKIVVKVTFVTWGWILCRWLEWEQGTVSSRVALLLWSAEVKPLFYRFVQHLLNFSFLTVHTLEGRHSWALSQWAHQARALVWWLLRAGSSVDLVPHSVI